MAEYIDREAVTSLMLTIADGYKYIEIETEHLIERLWAIPTADVVEVVRCCECVYHDDESQYHYCRKWRRNCPNDSEFFCKWGKRKDGGQDEAPAGPYDLLYEEGGPDV